MSDLLQALALEVDERPFHTLPAPRRAMWKKVATVMGSYSPEEVESLRAENARLYEMLAEADPGRVWRAVKALAEEWEAIATIHHGRGRGNHGACPVCLMCRTHARELRNRAYGRPVGRSNHPLARDDDDDA